ncbi:MAG: GAF domain-containing protein [Magnetococcales bacterium]|nr:GAF domain-containing protein [Magnetococcales bacterium]
MSQDFDAFRDETAVLTRAEELLAVPGAEVGRDAFEALAKSYRKLLKLSQRLTRLSDRSEERVKEAHDRIQEQQKELEEAHHLLERHADALEERVRIRTHDLQIAEQKLARLVDNGIQLGQERDRNKLLRTILFGARDLTPSSAATLFLKTERNTLSFAMRTLEGDLPAFEIPMIDPQTGQPNNHYMVVHSALHNETIVVDDVYAETRFDLSGTKKFSEESGFRTVSMLTVPLSPREGNVIGLLQLLNAINPETGEIIPFPKKVVRFVEALAAQSAVALENHNLVEAQKVLMESLIKLIAGAIDAKSPYTGGHCERVPELAVMLAQEAAKVTEGPLADFAFVNDDEWREFRIGAWLHDCGKVVTPEFVVDKATKLETIHNRIHEVRMRFEVLWRDARIACLEAIACGEDEAQAKAALEARLQELTADYAFVAECNIGGEFMDPGRMERLRRIAAQTWQRHFDDRLGLSHEELKRYQGMPVAELPADEPLLSDKPCHLIARERITHLDPTKGFRMQVPENLYNQGEMYNLSIARGTLTEEERFKINEHTIQTIHMLESLPLPQGMQRIPEYAGSHHETLIGTGYPRKLDASQLSIPSRIMAIADIFEALTACDRPYKKPKTLSEAVKILSFFKKDKHIDADLFDLFLTSGVFRKYGEIYLKPEQLDAVDVAHFIGARPLPDLGG